MFYTYLYFNPITDVPFYIGKGKDDRANSHIKLSNNCTNKQVLGHIRNLRSEGIEPVVEIIHTKNEQAAFWLERCFIAAYGRKDLGTGSLLNHTDGGEGVSGLVMTAETRSRMSVSAKGNTSSNGKIVSNETRTKISNALKGKPKPSLKGKRRTQATRAKMSAARKAYFAVKRAA